MTRIDAFAEAAREAATTNEPIAICFAKGAPLGAESYYTKRAYFTITNNHNPCYSRTSADSVEVVEVVNPPRHHPQPAFCILEGTE
jgi:hypothetical protein